MFKNRRVGTLTLGVCLIAFGLLFITRQFFPSLNYTFIFSLWPIILILLGLEIIFSSKNNNENVKYDIGAFFLIILLSFFSAGMAVIELFIYNDNTQHIINNITI